jgi:N-acetylmuramoyl-L-alanine amidase
MRVMMWSSRRGSPRRHRARALALIVLGAAGVVPAARAGAPSEPAPFVVALDPGHGGSNLGAAAADGVVEKQVTLALARRLRARLQATPGVRVVLCRDADVLVPIRARSRCAARAGADLFLSLHANATPAGVAPGSQRGFELYVLPPEDVADDALVAALGAPPADAVWSAHRTRAAGEASLAAATALEARLRTGLGAGLARGVRQGGAALDVLRGAGVPAVLVEVGFLDDPRDRPMLTTPAGQDRLAAVLAAGVRDVRAAAPR